MVTLVFLTNIYGIEKLWREKLIRVTYHAEAGGEPLEGALTLGTQTTGTLLQEAVLEVRGNLEQGIGEFLHDKIRSCDVLGVLKKRQEEKEVLETWRKAENLLATSRGLLKKAKAVKKIIASVEKNG